MFAQANQGSPPMSKIRILTLVIGALALIAIFVTLVVALAAVLARFADGLGQTWFIAFKLHWVIAIFALFRLAGRGALPIRWRIVGSAVIDAPVERIWALVLPRPGQPYYSNSVVRISAPGNDPNRVTLHYDDALAEPGESAGPALAAVIEAQEPGKRLVLRYENAEILPLLGQDLVASETLIEPVPGDGYKVTFIEHMRAFRLASMLVFLHLNPCQDATLRLKALCEGREDGSWMGTTIDAIRENPDAAAAGGNREFVIAAAIVAVGVIGGLIAFTPALFRFISGL